MKTLKLLLVFFYLGLSFNSFSQNLFFIGNKSYPCTESFKLSIGDGDYSYQSLECIIAKNGSAGFFIISKETFTGSVIKGNAIIYLDDGTVITLIDRGRRDYVNQISTNVYSLTEEEINKLKNSQINTVRFSIRCLNRGCYSSDDGDYAAKNISSGYGYSRKERINTIELVENLFK